MSQSDNGYVTMNGGQQAVIEINGQGSAQPVVNYTAEVPVDTETGFTVSVAISPNTPSGEAHNNVHPVIGCYYIMYLP